MAEGKPLLSPDEPAEGAEAISVPHLLEGKFENVSHVERETWIETALGIDEGVVFHRGAGHLLVPVKLRLAVIPHHFLDREVRVGFDLKGILPAADGLELLRENLAVDAGEAVLGIGGV